jgi:hypothetical protein
VGDSLTDVSVEVVILVLSGLVAVNLVLVSALLTTVRQDRSRRAAPPARRARGPESSKGSRSGSV